MEEKITILQIETKQTKAGAPMWTATTSAGKISCFDKPLAEELFTLIGKQIVAEITTQGNYKNLKRIVSKDIKEVEASNAPKAVSEQEQRVPSMCVSYAKDLCVAGKVEYKDLKAVAKNLLTIYEELVAGK
jgi:hypothetical protein